MAAPLGLDLDLLRSFVIIAEEKSFTRAAERVGRTQSAVSLQMQRLEAMLGHLVLDRGKGGNVELNQQGKYLLLRAREILSVNDDIIRAMKAEPIHGTVRLGIAEEFSQRFLPRILENFAFSAPGVEVTVTVAASCLLAVKLKNGEQDVVVLERGLEPRQWPAEEVWRIPLHWITSDVHRQHLRDPLPLTVSPDNCPWRPPGMNECLWRGLALRALEKSGRSFRIVSTSGSTPGQLAAAQAGLAVAASVALNLPMGLRIVGGDEGLPELPELGFLMLKGRDARQPMTDLLAAQIREVTGQVDEIASG